MCADDQHQPPAGRASQPASYLLPLMGGSPLRRLKIEVHDSPHSPRHLCGEKQGKAKTEARSHCRKASLSDSTSSKKLFGPMFEPCASYRRNAIHLKQITADSAMLENPSLLPSIFLVPLQRVPVSCESLLSWLIVATPVYAPDPYPCKWVQTGRPATRSSKCSAGTDDGMIASHVKRDI